jgi:hypothetical protein
VLSSWLSTFTFTFLIEYIYPRIPASLVATAAGAGGGGGAHLAKWRRTEAACGFVVSLCGGAWR